MNKCSAICSDFRWSNSDGPIFPTEKNQEMIEIEKVHTQFLKRLIKC